MEPDGVFPWSGDAGKNPLLHCRRGIGQENEMVGRPVDGRPLLSLAERQDVQAEAAAYDCEQQYGFEGE